MNVMDLDLQREHRAELLREAENGRLARGNRESSRGKGARGLLKLAGAWVLSR